MLKKFRAILKCIHFNGTPFLDNNHDSNTHPFRCDLNEYNYGWKYTEKGSLYYRAAHPVTNNRIMCSVDVSCFFFLLTVFSILDLSLSLFRSLFFDRLWPLVLLLWYYFVFNVRHKAENICIRFTNMFFPFLFSFTLFSIQTSWMHNIIGM